MDGGAIFRKFGLDLVGVVRTQFGAGVTSKTSAVMVTSVVMFCAICIWMPDSAYKPVALMGLCAFVAFWLIGTWVHTSVTPLHSLEGQNWVEIYRNSTASKGLPTIPTTAITENPKYKSDDEDGALS